MVGGIFPAQLQLPAKSTPWSDRREHTPSKDQGPEDDDWGVGIGVWGLGCGKRAHADHRTGLRSMAAAKEGRRRGPCGGLLGFSCGLYKRLQVGAVGVRSR